MTLLHCEGSDIGLRLVEDCVCSGYSVTYECITRGPGSTVFIFGTAQECEIDLRHSQFASGTAIGQCMDGTVNGSGVSFDRDLFTSQLVVFVNSNLLGKTVRCEYFDGTVETEVGSLVLNLTTISGICRCN